MKRLERGVTACVAAAITLGAAAAMTSRDKVRVAQLPDTRGMPNRVVIQAGHCISFGVPVAQMIRLSGAEIVEVGDRRAAIEHAVAWAGPGDIVLIAGKGHESGQTGGGHTRPFDDRDELAAALEALKSGESGT